VLFSGPKNIFLSCRKITRTRELQLHVCNSILNLCNLKLFLFFSLVYSAWILFTLNVFIILNISNEVALVPTEICYHDVGHGVQYFYSHSEGKTCECKGWIVVKSNIRWWRSFTILYYTTLHYTMLIAMLCYTLLYYTTTTTTNTTTTRILQGFAFFW